MRVIIMRGLPGSGKSTWIERNFDRDQAFICSADRYFKNGPNGEYQFDPRRIGDAHAWCQKSFLTFLERWRDENFLFEDFLIVDNTNIKLWEMAYYVGLSRVFGIEPEIVRIEAEVETCIRRNVHDVPAETIMRMHSSMEKVPHHFAHERIVRQ